LHFTWLISFTVTFLIVSRFLLRFRLTPQAGKCINGKSTLTDLHDSVQAKVDNAMWVNEFLPFVKVSDKVFVEILFWLFYRLELYCGIVGKFAMYIAGNVTSHPGLITIYTAYHPEN
jgi:hypothetical protein